MGGVAVLHPQDCLKDNHPHHLFPSPVKSRRPPKSNPNFSSNPNPPNSNPNSTRSEGRKRSPPKGVRKNKPTSPMVTDPPAAAVAKNLVMGQVKILKRGEPLDESLSVLKDMNDRKVEKSQSPVKDGSFDRKVGKDPVTVVKVSSAKKKSEKLEKEKRRVLNFNFNKNPNFKIENLKPDDFALSSTNRLGPDPEMVPKQMSKNIADFFFAGSAFVDSPPPSSLPLPGFFTKSFVAVGKEEDPSTDLRRMLGLNV